MHRFVVAVLLIFVVSMGARGQTTTPSGVINILDYNAKCDGQLVTTSLVQQFRGLYAPLNTSTTGPMLTYYTGTDDTAAISAALAAAMMQNKPLYIPGSYPTNVMSGAKTGYCLMKSGNPLGQAGAEPSQVITSPVTIESDGKDVSRLVWFVDDDNGSVTGIVSAGKSYQPGDVVDVVDGSGTHGLRLEVVTVDATGEVTNIVAIGASSFSPANLPSPGATTVTNCPVVNIPGTQTQSEPNCSSKNGSGLTVSLSAGGSAIGSAYSDSYDQRISNITLRDFSIIGTGQQNPGQAKCGGAMGINIYSANDITIQNVGVDWSRCMSVVIRQGQDAIISGNRIRWSARDMINVSSSRTIVSNNVLEHGGDDGIAVSDQVGEMNAVPAYREGVVVSGNYLTDVQGIVALGSAGVSITGNTMERVKLRGINVSTGSGGEGSTPTRSVVVSENSISDMVSIPGDPISNGGTGGINECFVVGTTPPAQGSGVAVPGFPASTGQFVSPYPFYNTNNTLGPIPPGIDVNISDNTCVRTIPATNEMWSSLNFGAIYGSGGFIPDFEVSPTTVVGTRGIEIDEGIISNLNMSNNLFSGLQIGLNVESGTRLLDSVIRANIFRDVGQYGIAFVGTSAQQRILFDDNLWDGDPYFNSVNRATASGATNRFTGAWTTTSNPNTNNFPTLSFRTPSQGVEWHHNRVRNWAALGSLPANDYQVGNVLYLSNNASGAQTGIGGGPFTGQALGVGNPGWQYITEDGDPRSQTFGQVTAATTAKVDVAATGATAITVAASTSWLLLNQTGSLASQTIILPSAPPDGHTLRIYSQSAISSLTLSPAVPSAPKSVAAGGSFTLGWDANSTSWLLLQ